MRDMIGLLPVLQTKVLQNSHPYLTKRKKADTNYLIDQQRFEV